MSGGRLQVMPVPWMVSPSVPELRIRIMENGDTQVALDVAVLPTVLDDASELVNCGVEVHFRHGQWVRTHPAASDIDAVPTGLFDRSAVEFGSVTGDPKSWMRRFRAEWMRQGHCPDPSFYEVLESRWIKEENAARFGCRHFVLVGHDLWIEVLCVAVEWHWIAPGALGLDPRTLVGSS